GINCQLRDESSIVLQDRISRAGGGQSSGGGEGRGERPGILKSPEEPRFKTPITGMRAVVAKLEKILTQRRLFPVINGKDLIVGGACYPIVAGINEPDRIVGCKRNSQIANGQQAMIITPKETDTRTKSKSDVLVHAEADFICEWPTETRIN